MNKAIFFLLPIFLLSFVMNAGCADEKNTQKKQQKNTSKGDQMTVKFKTVQYIDKDGIGIEAFRILIPSDWKFEGGIYWTNLDNPAMPAVSAIKVSNPDGSEELETFPNQMFFWTDNPMTMSMFPAGSRYFGAEVRQPTDSLGYIENILIQRARGDVSGLRIMEKQKLPELAKQLVAGQQQPGIKTSVDSGKVRIEYQKNGKIYEETIFAVIEYLSFPIQSMYGTTTNTNWIGDYLFSFKAEKGKLDASTKVLQTMVNSFQVNPQWFNKYNQLVQYLIQNQIRRIQAIGQISRIISQTSNEISDMMMQSYNDRQATYDRISDNFSQMIRGVDSYYNPIEQKSVELPSGYGNAWTNSLVEYILSDDPNYNPNIGSNLNWQEMKMK